MNFSIVIHLQMFSPRIILLAKCSDLVVVFLAELYLLKVGHDTFFSYAFWDHRVTSINTPGNENLCRRGIKFLRDVLDDWKVSENWLVAHFNMQSVICVSVRLNFLTVVP